MFFERESCWPPGVCHIFTTDGAGSSVLNIEPTLDELYPEP